MASQSVVESPRTGSSTSGGKWRVFAVLAVAYWAYVVNGVLNSIIGPSLLGMVHTFRIDLATAGTIFTAQFIGYLLGAFGSGLAAERLGYKRVLFPTAALIAVGTAGTALAGSWFIVIALTVLAGFGFGVSDSLCNAVVAAEAPRAGGAALNLLHTFFGVGALAGPLLAGALIATPAGWQGAFLVTGVMAGSCAILFLLVPMPSPAHPAAQTAAMPNVVPLKKSDGLRSMWRGSYLWLLAGLLLIFVGMEQTIGGWSSAYLHRVLGASTEVAAGSASIYWAAVTCGRLLASAAALRISNERLLGSAAVLSLGALVLLALAGGPGTAFLALALTGLGFAAIYPTIMAVTARAFPRRFATIAGLMAAAGGLGGAVYPWVGGVVGQAWGLRATMWMAVVLAMALLVVFAFLIRLGRPVEPAA